MTHRLARILAAALLAVSVSGCASVASFVATTATEMSSSTPAQVRTYAEATQAATLATNAVDLAINVHKFDRATLLQLNALNEGVHTAWLGLKAANDAGQNLNYAVFNEALKAFLAYKTVKGI